MEIKVEKVGQVVLRTQNGTRSIVGMIGHISETTITLHTDTIQVIHIPKEQVVSFNYVRVPVHIRDTLSRIHMMHTREGTYTKIQV